MDRIKIDDLALEFGLTDEQLIDILVQNGIKFDFVGGTSAGSMAAALYSMGFTSDEMLKIALAEG